MVLVFCFVFKLLLLEPASEQVAYEFFVKEIFIKEYPTEKDLYFSGCTEKQNSLSAPFPKCFQSDKELIDFFYKMKVAEAEEVKIRTDVQTDIKLLKKQKAKALRVAIYKSSEFAGSDYVYISVYKPREFVDHYIIKIMDQKVIDHCKVSEVI